MSNRIAALILAGGKNKPAMTEACGGIENRALVPLNGRPMLDYVVDAVHAGLSARNAEGGPPSRLLVAGDVPLPLGCLAVQGGTSMIDTLLAGAAALMPDENRLLVVTADIPFLTGDAVADFLKRSAALGSDVQLVYPIIEASLCLAKFPDMRRTTLRVAEGNFTGGNLTLIDPSFLRDKSALLQDAYARRKSVTALARLLGPDLLLRLVGSRAFPGLLGIPRLEKSVGKALGGVNARALITAFPEIAADIDHPEDIALAERILRYNADSGREIVDAETSSLPESSH